MKYIVIGLGRFGSMLASTLATSGHEVIGIDNREDRCEEIKDSISTTMRLDSTNVNAVKTLPLNDIDAVIVAIGEDVGASVLTLSILKNLNVQRIIGRAVNQTHRDILNHIGIEEVVLPLEDSALHVSSMLQLKDVFRITEITEDYAIAEVQVPEKYAGHSLDTVNMEERFRIKAAAIKSAPKRNIINSIFRRNYTVELFYDKSRLLRGTDIIIVAGKIPDIKRFMES
ncbi:MAG: TrkA family potassium uptake protein [Bacteroidales bacterium]